MSPQILAFTDQHLSLSSLVGPSMFILPGALDMLIPVILSGYLDSQPAALFVFEAGGFALWITFFIILKFLIHKKSSA